MGYYAQAARTGADVSISVGTAAKMPPQPGPSPTLWQPPDPLGIAVRRLPGTPEQAWGLQG